MPVKIGGTRARTLDTYEGLYDVAYDSGLRDQADDILARNSGEEYKQVFSGGTLSDIFDVLSLDSYGVVGMLKGKSFMDGVKNRESFSDKDALGQYGLVGGILGMVADIAVSPTTYIAPWKALTKVPGVTAAVGAGKNALFGKTVNKAIMGGKTYEVREGGLQAAKWLSDKLVYGSGQDKSFIEMMDKAQRDQGVGTIEALKMIEPLKMLDDKLGEALIERTPTGAFQRKGLTQLQRELDSETLAKVAPIWNRIDELGKELVDLGILGKGKYEENLGHYIKNSYLEYEQASKKGNRRGLGMFGVSGQKARKDLDLKTREELQQIESPAYLAASTLLKMNRDVVQGRLMKNLNEKFGSDIAFEGAELIPKTKRFETSQGKIYEKAAKLKEVRDAERKEVKGLTKLFSKDKKIATAIRQIERLKDNATTRSTKELNKYFEAGARKADEIVGEDGVRDFSFGFAKENKYISGTKAKVKEGFDERSPVGATTKTGIKDNINPQALKKSLSEMSLLKKKFIDENRGFKRGATTKKASISEYQDALIKIIEKNFELKDMGKFRRLIKNTTDEKSLNKAISRLMREAEVLDEKTMQAAGESALNKAVKLQKEVVRLAMKSDKLTQGEKAQIQKAMLDSEARLSTLRFKKEDILDEIDMDRMGDLAGKYIPKEMKEFIDEMNKASDTGIGAQIMAEFKFSKVVLSPATHIRNVLSNMTLNWWKLGMVPNPAAFVKAWGEISSDAPIVQRARKAGLGASTFASQELKGLLDDPQMLGISDKVGSKWTRWKKTIGDVYQKEEEVAKLMAFKHGIKKGLTDEQAWKAAEEATFNYAQVTPFIKNLRTSLYGAPFITFAVKALPAAIETAGRSPGRIAFFQKLRNAIEEQSPDIKETEEEKAAMPDWMKEGFFIKWPWGKDEHGRTPYIDLTYIIPFSSLITQGADVVRSVSGEKGTGRSETLGQAGLSETPFLNIIKEIGSNKDFAGNKIVKETDPIEQQVIDLSMYFAKTFAPPPIAAQIPVGYNQTSGERVDAGLYKSWMLGDEPKQAETLAQELASYGALKIRPFDEEIQSGINDWNKRTELEKLLVDNGVLKRYSSVYEPK